MLKQKLDFEVSEKILRIRMSMIEGFAKQFFDTTGLSPHHVELCEQMNDGVIAWWFRPRTHKPGDILEQEIDSENEIVREVLREMVVYPNSSENLT